MSPFYALALVGCGRRKAASPAPARHLYTSNLVQLSLAYAEPRAERTFVASALHGLVSLDTVVEPYQVSLYDASALEQHAWARSIALDVGPGAGRPLLLLAGGQYACLLAQHLAAHGWAIHEPLRGLMVGERLHWLSTQLRSAA